MTFRSGYVLAFVSVVASAATTAANGATEKRNYPENSYVYTNLREPIERLLIVNDPDLKVATRSDLSLNATIVDEPSTAGPIIFAFDWPHNVAFYLPGDFNSQSSEWNYQNCNYLIIAHAWGFHPRANQEVHHYQIEQRCENDTKIVRYEYADYYGLQSIVIGTQERTDLAEPRLDIEEVYSLYGASFGFGARN